MRVLLVCLGNICRSPTGEAALREAAAEVTSDLGMDLEIDSAGTAAYHVGQSPDDRMTRVAADAGLELRGSARQVAPEDFRRYDLILAMDRDNLTDLRRIAPEDATAELRLFREFEEGADGLDVPDPYYGGRRGFEEVVGIARRGAAGLVAAVRNGDLGGS